MKNNKKDQLIMNEYEKKTNQAIGYAAALFDKYILTDKNRFNEFISIISEEDKDRLLNYLLLQDEK